MHEKLIINRYETLDSTNEEAFRRLDSAPEGSVWTARYQTAGRGQRGNTWESSRGKNLMFTLLLRPEFLPAAQQFAVSEIVALGVCRYIRDKGIPAKIKWPNDIYVEDRKICGILIEHTIAGANLSASILGVGINMNQVRFASDAPNPTSLLLERIRRGGGGSWEEIAGSGKEAGGEISAVLEKGFPGENVPGDFGEAPVGEYDVEKELELVLDRIWNLYEALAADASFPGKLEEKYLSCLYRMGEWHWFIETETNRKIRGRIRGIDSTARLLVEQEDGTRKAYAFKEIRYVL